jgi:hypothetical protein
LLDKTSQGKKENKKQKQKKQKKKTWKKRNKCKMLLRLSKIVSAL